MPGWWSSRSTTRSKPVGEACVIGHEFLKQPKSVQVQFRYAYVCDEEGIKVLDVTRLEEPKPLRILRLLEAHAIYSGPHLRLCVGRQNGAW